MLGGEEAHQVGHVRRADRGHQLAQARQVAAIGGVHHHGHEAGVEGVVLAERELAERRAARPLVQEVRRVGHGAPSLHGESAEL
jgi:hypothetical protein